MTEYHEHHEHGNSLAIGLALGIAVGLAIGFLYAPHSGRETRAMLRDKVMKAEHALEEAKDKAKEIIAEAKGKAAEITEAARKAKA